MDCAMNRAFTIYDVQSDFAHRSGIRTTLAERMRGQSVRQKGKRKDGRGEWIRTTDLTVPNRALYQAEPRPDKSANWILGSGRGYVNGRASAEYSRE